MLEIKLVNEISETFMKNEWIKKEVKKFITSIPCNKMSNVEGIAFI